MSWPGRSAHAEPTCAPSWPWPTTTKGALPIRLRPQIFWSSSAGQEDRRYIADQVVGAEPELGVPVVEVQHRQVVGGGCVQRFVGQRAASSGWTDRVSAIGSGRDVRMRRTPAIGLDAALGDAVGGHLRG